MTLIAGTQSYYGIEIGETINDTDIKSTGYAIRYQFTNKIFIIKKTLNIVADHTCKLHIFLFKIITAVDEAIELVINC